MKISFVCFRSRVSATTRFLKKREGGVENLRFFCGFAPYFHSIIQRIMPSFFLRNEIEEGRCRTETRGRKELLEFWPVRLAKTRRLLASYWLAEYRVRSDHLGKMGRKNRGTESLDRPESKINEPNTPARTDIPSSSSCGNSPTPLNLGIGVFVIITAMIRITVSIAHLDPSSSSSLSRLGMLGNFAPILGILVFFSCNCKSMCSRAATSYFVLIVFTPLAAGCLVLGGFRGYYFLRLVS